MKRNNSYTSHIVSFPAIVTGCTGSVGVALIEKLVKKGYTVYAVLNPESKRNTNVRFAAERAGD